MEQVFQGMILRSVFKDRSVMGSRQMQGRRYHGFILKLEGETQYDDGQKTLRLAPGDILFVPQNAVYAIREIHPGYSCVVNFEGCPGWPEMQLLSVPAGLDVTTFAEKLSLAWQKEEGVYGILSQLYGFLDKALSDGKRKTYLSPSEKQFLTPAMDYLKENLTEPSLQISAMAQKAGVSAVYLRRIFKKKYGISPAAWIIRERMRLAKNLLEGGEFRSVQAVAAQVGYRDSLYFSRIFRKQFGLSPTEYCRQYAHDLF